MARNPATRWYGALAVLVVFILLAWLLGAVLTLTEGERVALRVGLVTLGLIAAVSLLWYLRPDQETAAAPKDKRTEDVASLVASARSRLPRGAFHSRALVLVLGSEKSCKTTTILQSGTDPELLAGNAPGGIEIPPPTALANFWLVKNAVLAEAGGGVFTDPALWQRLVRALRAPRLAAALGRAEPAPRAAVVCVSCDIFRSPDAHTQLETLAKLTRERLTQAARAWGMSVPVYVLFTKADRIPHFETWVAPLSREEVRSPLGAALPFDAAGAASGKARAQAAGTYAERVVPRVESRLAGVVAALASHRLDFLGRESQADRRLAAYEFPRELGKLAPAAAKFLVEICRPVHLGVSPQLRGFYFVGARPVVVSEAAPVAAAARPATPQVSATAGATSVFRPQQALEAERAAAEAPARAGSKRVPQWVFLERLLPDVILADRSAAAMARGGVRVATVRRAFLGAGIAAALVLSLGVLRSWMGNSALAERVSAASRDVTALPVVSAPQGTIAFPSPDALRRLEALRGVLDSLKRFADSGVPRRLTWGLWRGDTLLGAGRRVWLNGYNSQLHATAFGALFDTLRALPDVPRATDEYGHDYDMLKGYLVMTAEPRRSTPAFLAPVLLNSWKRGQEIDPDVLGLARLQFEFYAALLAQENPFPQDADLGIVNRTRSFLSRFTGEEQVYQIMLAKANKAVPPLRLAEVVPQAQGKLVAPAEMPGAFTAAGWEYLQNEFRDSGIAGEPWVVGDATAQRSEDRDRVLAAVRARYVNDYVQRWRTFVRGTTVVSFGSGRDGVRNAAAKIGDMGSNQSPLLAVLALVARNTNVDSAVAVAFQPVHRVVPPGATAFIHEGNQSYANSLVALQGALEAVNLLPPATDTASTLNLVQKAQESFGPVTAAKAEARLLSQKFAVDTAAAKIAPVVSALLLQPINGAEGVLKGVASTRPPSQRVVAAPAPAPAPAPGGGGGGPPPPSGGGDAKAAELAAILNERGRAICSAMTPMLAKFPFNPDATSEATVAEVAGLLAPGSGELFAFQQERLGDLLEKQGGQWVAKGGGPVALSAPFVTFFNRAAQRSAALFGGGSAPRVVFLARGMTSAQTPLVTLVHGSQVAPFNQNTPPAQFVWPAPSGREARLMARFGKEKEQVVSKATGEWAIFRLVAMSAGAQGDGGALRAEWNATGKGAVPVAVEFNVESGAPVFKRGWLGGMTCTPQVTR